MGVTTRQRVLLLLLSKPVTDRQAALPNTVKALLALSNESFNLSRCAYSIIAQGYPFQSLGLLRAIYERIAVVLHVRQDDALARAFIDGDRDAQPKYATVFKEQFPVVYDELIAFIDRSAVPAGTLDSARDQLGKFYGQLSDFTHPGRDAFSVKFREADSERTVWFQYGPRKDPDVVEQLVTSWLWVLLFLLETVLLVDFRDYLAPEWSRLTSHWLRSLANFTDDITPTIVTALAQTRIEAPE